MIREEDVISYLKEERAKPIPKGRPPSWGITAYWDGYNAALGMVIDQMQARIEERPAASGEGS